MRISLLRFLRTGRLGELGPGVSAEQVRRLLGEPAVPNSAEAKFLRHQPRKRQYRSRYSYGLLTVSFSEQPPHTMTQVFCTPGNNGLEGWSPGCEIEDWVLTCEMRQADVKIFLSNNGLPFEYEDAASAGDQGQLVLPSGVYILFTEDKWLYAIFTL